MLLLAVPCVILVELAEVFAFFNDRRRARLLAATPYPGLSPEEVSEFGLDAGGDQTVDAGTGQSD
jgi:sec-independent protein translocase protein TatC